MTSILDIEISGFANYQSTTPKQVNLLSWLQSDKYAKQVDLIRCEADKDKRNELKAKLPAITPSGTFTERSLKGWIKHSGFIQFDIDGVPDIQAAKQKICGLTNVAYCGLSVSGRGLWGLIPIAEPEHHKEYFDFIQKVFAGMGITIDPACKDVSRLRGYSYDADAYFNHSAMPLQKWYRQQTKPVQKRNYNHISGGGNASKVEFCLNEIRAKGIDLTPNYDQWFKIGCSLANEFGEAGRDYFHSISQFHPKYNPQDTDKQFSHCLRHRYSTTIATFFAACRDAGIMFQAGIFPQTIPPYRVMNNDIPRPDRWAIFNRLLNQAFADTKQLQSGAITGDQWQRKAEQLQTEWQDAGITDEEFYKSAFFWN